MRLGGTSTGNYVAELQLGKDELYKIGSGTWRVGNINRGIYIQGGTLIADGTITGTARVYSCATLNVTNATLEVNALNVPSKPIAIATYGTLHSPFAAITGADDWDIDYAYEGSQIALLPPPSGTVLLIR